MKGVDSKSLSHLQKLDDIQTPFTALEFRDVGLRAF